MQRIKAVLFLLIACVITLTGLYVNTEPAQAAKCFNNFSYVDCETIFGNAPEESYSTLPVVRETQLFLNNSCWRPIRVALSFKDYAGAEWTSANWWELDPYESYYPSFNGYTITPNGAPLYYYAEATDGSGYNWSGDTPVGYNGATYYTRARELSALLKDGRYELKLTCN